MKKLLIGAAAICATSVPVAADYVYVEINGDKQRFNVGDREETSVCTLKRNVADAADMKMKEFDLMKSGIRLKEEKTLKGSNVSNGNTLTVKPVNRSFQCT